MTKKDLTANIKLKTLNKLIPTEEVLEKTQHLKPDAKLPATFYVEEDFLVLIKALAYRERTTITDTINEILEFYFENISQEKLTQAKDGYLQIKK